MNEEKEEAIEENESFIYDTYALLEIINANPNYKKYIDKNIIINDFIFTELCYKLYREKVPNADDKVSEVEPAIVHADPDVIKEAMQFRLKWKDRGVSMTDCIGYKMAEKLGIKFLTGDKEFVNMENVEFVK